MKDTDRVVNRLSARHPQLENLLERAPHAAEMIHSFAALSVARSECSENLDLQNITDFNFDSHEFTQGNPLLASIRLQPLKQAFLESAACLLPLLPDIFPGLSGPLQAVHRALKADNPETERLFDFLLVGDFAALAGLADKLGIEQDVLEFAGRETLKACLLPAAQQLEKIIRDVPWSREYCPVCGSTPDLTFLRPKDPEPSDYLISKSGQLWMHCSLCAHNWRYVRSKCPHCQETGSEKLIYYSSPDRENERIYVCENCRHYFPCLDTADRRPFPDLTVEPIALMHLDQFARQKGYIPLTPTPWNQME